jgi:NADH-quinone oxidoreductase subunit L
MVTAGVYLLCRLYPLVSLSGVAMLSIAVVGAATALYAATCAATQREIKRVLAYSTMSQVGFMFLAVGVGSVAGALFHLFTHAFFKALLFMAAGGVIHLAGGENDIQRMGGIARQSKTLFALFLLGALCLAGAPLTGGFFSKDAILAAVAAKGGPVALALLAVGLYVAMLTAFYTFRLVYLVFPGVSRGAGGEHHLPQLMLLPLLPLALFGLAGGLLNLPDHGWLAGWLGPWAGAARHLPPASEWGLAAASTVLVLAGWLLARWRYRHGAREEEGAFVLFLRSGWQADALVERWLLRPFAAISRFCHLGIDRAVIDDTLEMTAQATLSLGERLRLLASGRVSHYLSGVAWGLLLLIGWLLLASVGG